MEPTPWNVRTTYAEHERVFLNLQDLHRITLQWLEDLQGAPDENSLTRVLSPASHEGLRKLSEITQSRVPTNLEEVLIDETPEEYLNQLSRTVAIAQAWAIGTLMDRTPAAEKPALINSLEQSSLRAGRACAKRRWPTQEQAPHLPWVYACLLDSPIVGVERPVRYLVIRSTLDQIELELLECAHRSTAPEVVKFDDVLCRLQSKWVLGFVQALMPRALVDLTQSKSATSGRCRETWTLFSGS